MANFPCPNPIACPGVDSPVANLSAELPDVRKFFGYNFFEDETVICESMDPDVQQFCNGPPPTNPPVPVVYVSNAQTCQVTCPDHSVISYTAVAGSAVGLSQAAADAQALDLACQIAHILCTGPLPPIFFNTAQSCQHACDDGSTVTYTVPAGTVAALSVANADALAHAFACELVALLCPEPPVSIDGLGAGIPPQAPLQPRFGNAPQQCTEPCPDGSLFTFHVRAGLFIRDTLAEANVVAASYACRQAELQKTCLSDLDQELCADAFSSQLIVATGMTGEITWSISAGGIPGGMTFKDGQLTGVPTTGGTFTFTVSASDADGHSVSRTYTVDVIQISPSSLPGGSVGAAYSQQVTQIGGAGPVDWAVTGGLLPDGLALDSVTGIISGTPAAAGLSNFQISVRTADAVFCAHNYSITVTGLAPRMYWTMDQAAGDRIDSILGNHLTPGQINAGTVTAVAGKISLAAQCNSPAAADVADLTNAAPTFQFAGTPLTWWGWFKYAGTVFWEIRYNDLAGSFFPGLVMSAGVLRLYNNNFGGSVLVTAPGAGAWHFFILEFTGTQMRVEFNRSGTVFAVATGAPGIGNDILIGVDAQGGGTNLAIDETGLIDSALTVGEKDFLWNAGAGRTYPF